MKIINTALTLVLLATPCFSGHVGEQRMLDVSIDFSGSFGTTVTDGSGVRYFVGNSLIGQEDKIYSSQYWGEFPLYFFGSRVGVMVRVANNGPRNNARLRIQTEAYVLRADGSSGAPLAAPRVVEVDLQRGESKMIDASFVVGWTPAADSGLDRFLVKVMHVNQGGGPGNAEPGLILVKEGVFCPPRFQQ